MIFSSFLKPNNSKINSSNNKNDTGEFIDICSMIFLSKPPETIGGDGGNNDLIGNVNTANTANTSTAIECGTTAGRDGRDTRSKNQRLCLFCYRNPNNIYLELHLDVSEDKILEVYSVSKS